MKTVNWIILKSNDRGSDYGVGTFINQLMNGLIHKKQIDVYILEIRNNSSLEFYYEKRSGITYFIFPKTTYVKQNDTITNNIKYAKSIVRLALLYLPKKEINIVHMNFVFQYFIGKEFKNNLDCILIFTQHLFIPDVKEIKSPVDIEPLTYSLVDKIITVTQHGKLHLYNKPVDKSKIQNIYNGIDPSLFRKTINQSEIRKKYILSENEKIILYSGRFDTIKGLKYLFLAYEILLKKMPNCHLVLAGDGEIGEFTSKTNILNSSITFLGFIPFQDIISLYHSATIGVIPSLEEHCSYVALEMLHSGLPVVATNLGGLKEIFTHNENAFLVNTITDKTNAYGVAPNINELADYMYTLLVDEQLRKKFSLNGKLRAKEEFSLNKMTNKYIESIIL